MLNISAFPIRAICSPFSIPGCGHDKVHGAAPHLPILPPGEHRLDHLCPDGKRAKKTLGVTVQHDGSAMAHCFRCEYAEAWRARGSHHRHHRPGKAAFRPVAPSKRERLAPHWHELFNACSPLSGTAGEQYLQARGCVVPPDDADLRFHPELHHPSGYRGPALVALVTHAETRVPLTLHRTWIRPDGTKADVDPPRLLLGGHRKAGGVIRLWPDEAVTYGLAVAEGIETALSLAHAFEPVWSVIDAGNLATLPVLYGIETLVIGADHDDAGLKAANSCADRWAAAGLEVHVIAPRGRRQGLERCGASGMSATFERTAQAALKKSKPHRVAVATSDEHVDEHDPHRNAPYPDPACLYGLVGDVARAGSETTEAPPPCGGLEFPRLSERGGRSGFVPAGGQHLAPPAAVRAAHRAH